MLGHAQRALEETGQEGQEPALAPPPRHLDQPHQVQHQRGRQHRIATLPGELQRHGRAEEAGEMDVVPGRLPFAQALDVFDGDERLRAVAEDFAQQMVLALDLGLLVGRVVQHAAIEVAEDIMADPTEDVQVPLGHERGQDALQERLAGLAVAAGVTPAAQIGIARRWPPAPRPARA